MQLFKYLNILTQFTQRMNSVGIHGILESLANVLLSCWGGYFSFFLLRRIFPFFLRRFFSFFWGGFFLLSWENFFSFWGGLCDSKKKINPVLFFKWPESSHRSTIFFFSTFQTFRDVLRWEFESTLGGLRKLPVLGKQYYERLQTHQCNGDI